MDDNRTPRTDIFGKFFDKHVERRMFKFKHMVFVGVIGSLLLSLLLFMVGMHEVFIAFTYYDDIKKLTIYVLKSADLFLFATVMIMFAFGSYNLFISHIDNVDVDEEDVSKNKIVPDWLQFTKFDELKAIFIKVIILILSITFLELIIKNAERFQSLELYNLLIVPLGIVMISYSLKTLESLHK